MFISLANMLLLITHIFIQRSEQPVMDNVQMQLLDYSKQVAMGLHYLSCKGFVHRDLAARNILVSKDNISKVLSNILLFHSYIMMHCRLLILAFHVI